jgi:hypothetical protein
VRAEKFVRLSSLCVPGSGFFERLQPQLTLCEPHIINGTQCMCESKAAVEGRGSIAMANILVNIEKGIEIGAEDALKWLSGANKAMQATPAVVAALATLVGAVQKPLAELAGAASNPLNIPLDLQTVADLKAVWPDLEAFLKTLGIKC